LLAHSRAVLPTRFPLPLGRPRDLVRLRAAAPRDRAVLGRRFRLLDGRLDMLVRTLHILLGRFDKLPCGHAVLARRFSALLVGVDLASQARRSDF